MIEKFIVMILRFKVIIILCDVVGKYQDNDIGNSY